MEKMTRNLLSPSKEEDGDGRETYFPSLDGTACPLRALCAHRVGGWVEGVEGEVLTMVTISWRIQVFL